VNGQLGNSPLGLQGDAFRALHPFQGAGDREGLAAERFELGAHAEVVSRIFRPAETRIGQAAEIVAPRIAAATGDGGGQELVSAAVVAGKVGVHAPPVQLVEQRVLREADRPAQGQQHGGTRQCEFPEHDNDSP
jgi:hypothetical protein